MALTASAGWDASHCSASAAANSGMPQASLQWCVTDAICWGQRRVSTVRPRHSLSCRTVSVYECLR